MKYKLASITNVILLSGFLLLPINSFAAPPSDNWNLPQEVSDQNVQVNFELDTTWHVVHGKTSDIKGKAWLADAANPKSVNVTLEIPVAKFNTDDSDRDETLREVMAADKFANVVFTATGLSGNCTPELTMKNGSCQDKLISSLKIREIKMPIELPVDITYENDTYKVSGKFPITWAEYGVEDPSIFLIAKVEPIAEVNFVVTLKKLQVK